MNVEERCVGGHMRSLKSRKIHSPSNLIVTFHRTPSLLLFTLHPIHLSHSEDAMQVCYSPQLRSQNKTSGTYTSPGTPDYGDNNILGFQKGWCSERVPLSNSSRRHISSAALMPFNSGRTLPSKWDDAERWITSPVSGSGVCKTPQPVQRQVRAKSGPLTTGVLVPEDEMNDENGVSRRDMATQMSPESSPEGSPDFIPPPGGYRSARMEVRDVEVDKRVTMMDNRSPEANELALTWNAAEGAMKLSKLEKEEARIAAWENLQNAKAEASIRKLEMKLEKKKAASMDRILRKHRAAQKKAQELRRNMSEDVSPRHNKFRSLRRYVTSSFKGCFSCKS